MDVLGKTGRRGRLSNKTYQVLSQIKPVNMKPAPVEEMHTTSNPSSVSFASALYTFLWSRKKV